MVLKKNPIYGNNNMQKSALLNIKNLSNLLKKKQKEFKEINE